MGEAQPLVRIAIGDIKTAQKALEGQRRKASGKGRITRSVVYETFEKWLYIEDRRRIDIKLATAITRKMKEQDGGTSIWLIEVGPSGGGKNEEILAFENPKTTKTIHSFTPRALISGLKKEGVSDLAPKLKDKLILIPDFSQLMKLHPNAKAQVWAQLRDLFDGRAGKQTGSGVDRTYSDIRTTLIGGVTPLFDHEFLIHQNLGSRELIWRYEIKDKEALMQKALANEGKEEEMRKELRETVNRFLDEVEIFDKPVPKRIEQKLKEYAKWLSKMRAPAEYDWKGRELRSDIVPEEPTRVLKQLKRLFVALKSLSPDYTDERPWMC